MYRNDVGNYRQNANNDCLEREEGHHYQPVSNSDIIFPATGTMLRVFDVDYPWELLRDLENDGSGKEILQTIKNNTHKMCHSYWDKDQDHVNFVVYLIARFKKDSIAHKKLHRICKSVESRFGNNWMGKPVCSLQFVVGLIDSHVSITFRSTWPSPSTPMPPNCNGPKINRQQCPRCFYWNPVNNFTGFCRFCQLYMKSSHEQCGPIIEQESSQLGWKQIGKNISFKMTVRPFFLQRRSGWNDLNGFEEDDQIRSFIKVNIGPNPSIGKFLSILSSEIFFALDRDDVIGPYYIRRLLESARALSKKKSPLRVICSVATVEQPSTTTTTSTTSSSVCNNMTPPRGYHVSQISPHTSPGSPAAPSYSYGSNHVGKYDQGYVVEINVTLRLFLVTPSEDLSTNIPSVPVYPEKREILKEEGVLGHERRGSSEDHSMISSPLRYETTTQSTSNTSSATTTEASQQPCVYPKYPHVDSVSSGSPQGFRAMTTIRSDSHKGHSSGHLEGIYPNSPSNSPSVAVSSSATATAAMAVAMAPPLHGINRSSIQNQNQGPSAATQSSLMDTVYTSNNIPYGIWSHECHVLTSFLSGVGLTTNPIELETSQIQLLCNSDELLLPSKMLTNHKFGGFCDFRTDLIGILENICREGFRIGRKPSGLILEEQLSVSSRTKSVTSLSPSCFNPNSNSWNSNPGFYPFVKNRLPNDFSNNININDMSDDVDDRDRDRDGLSSIPTPFLSTSHSSAFPEGGIPINRPSRSILDMVLRHENNLSSIFPLGNNNMNNNNNNNMNCNNGNNSNGNISSNNDNNTGYINPESNSISVDILRSNIYPNYIHNNTTTTTTSTVSATPERWRQSESYVTQSRQESFQLQHDLLLCQSLSRLLVELENLGHPVHKDLNTDSIPGLNVSLRQYQKQTLSWAMGQEDLEGGLMSLLYAPILSSRNENTGVFYSPITNEFICSRPVDIRGGLICDDMGMGKTIIILSLILLRPATPSSLSSSQILTVDPPLPYPSPSASTQTDGKPTDLLEDVVKGKPRRIKKKASVKPAIEYINCKATLVVCPVTLVGQWCNEVLEKINLPKFKMVGYYSSNRERDLEELTEADVVITTYETLASDYRRFSTSQSSRSSSRCKGRNSRVNTTTAASKTTTTSQSNIDGIANVNNYSTNIAKNKIKVKDLFHFRWHRIVLDESHKVKTACLMNDAVVKLCGQRRWCVTGTPFQSKLSDLAGQFRFLKIPVLDTIKFWNEIICKPNTRTYKDLEAMNIEPRLGYATMVSILRRFMIRHSKGMSYMKTSEPLLLLPPKYENICMINLTRDENEQYNKIEKIFLKRYKHILRQGMAEYVKSTLQLLSMIKDLQLTCAGGILSTQLMELLQSDPNDMSLRQSIGDCSICLDLIDDPMITACHHTFCADCIYGAIGHSLESRTPCPLCRRPVTSRTLKSAIFSKNEIMKFTQDDVADQVEGEDDVDGEYDPREDDPGYHTAESEDETTNETIFTTPFRAGGIQEQEVGNSSGLITSSSTDDNSNHDKTGDGDDGVDLESSKVSNPVVTTPCEMISKLHWLVEKLYMIQSMDSEAKILIFSQFNQTISWLELALPRWGFLCRSISAKLTMRQRARALDEFQHDPNMKIFILSMRAGAVGVNLTEANHVIVMEPCLNSVLEQQAMGRVYRIGQSRAVHIYRLICRNTIEERILWTQYMSDRYRFSHISTTNAAEMISNPQPSNYSNSTDVNGDTDDLLLRIRRGKRTSFNSGSESVSSSSSSIMSSDRIPLGKKQYDILFGAATPPADISSKIENDLECSSKFEMDIEPLDEESRLSTGGFKLPTVICREVEPTEMTLGSDVNSFSQDVTSSSPTIHVAHIQQGKAGRKRKNTIGIEVDPSDHARRKRPRRKSAVEGWRKVQEMVKMESYDENIEGENGNEGD